MTLVAIDVKCRPFLPCQNWSDRHHTDETLEHWFKSPLFIHSFTFHPPAIPVWDPNATPFLQRFHQQRAHPLLQLWQREIHSILGWRYVQYASSPEPPPPPLFCCFVVDWLWSLNKKMDQAWKRSPKLFHCLLDVLLWELWDVGLLFDDATCIVLFVGLKPGQRKVLFTCLKRNDKREVKVAQLAGSVAEMSAYHHGEVQGYASHIIHIHITIRLSIMSSMPGHTPETMPQCLIVLIYCQCHSVLYYWTVASVKVSHSIAQCRKGQGLESNSPPTFAGTEQKQQKCQQNLLR